MAISYLSHLNVAKTSPAKHKPSPVQCYVECVEVSGLPVEKFEQIDVGQNCMGHLFKIKS